MKIRLILIKLLVKSLWNGYYPVNSLRMAFDDTLEVLEKDDIKTNFITGFDTFYRHDGSSRKFDKKAKANISLINGGV